MKKLRNGLKRISAFLISVIMVVALFGIVPVIAADGPVFTEAFVRKLTSEHPLSSGQIYVGFGKQSIMPLALNGTTSGSTGLPLGGYGREENRIGVVGGANIATEQEIFSLCTATMDKNGNILLFVVLDINRSTRFASIRTRVSGVTGVPEEKIYISATHTHSSIPGNTEAVKVKGNAISYYSYQADQVALSCKQAILDLYPADMSVKTVNAINSKGKSVVNFIRNTKTSVTDYNGDPVTYANNHGAIYYDAATGKWKSTSIENKVVDYMTEADPQVQLIRFDRADDKNVLMCNFQAHPVVTGASNQTVISSDYVGSFRDAVEETLPNYRVAYYQGAAGNLNPVPIITTDRLSKKFTTKTVFDFNKNGKTITIKAGTTVNVGETSNSGILDYTGKTTSAAVRRVNSYLIGSTLAEFVTKNFNTGFKKANGGTIKSTKYTYTGTYHAVSDDIINNTALWMSALIWNTTDDQLKDIILGTYAFTDSHIEYMNYIKETVTSAEIEAIKTNSDRKDLTDEQAETIAKFVKRLHYAIDNSYNNNLTTAGGGNSLYTKSYTASQRYNSKSYFAETIPQGARNWLIYYLGGYTQSKDGGSIVIQSPYHANAIINRVNNEGKKYSANLYSASIGDVAFATFPGEMFDTNAMFIKENTAKAMTFILCYTNGALGGYFPSAFGHLYSTYEADTTITEIGTAEVWAGIQADTISDLTFADETYEMNIGDTKEIGNKQSGEELYSHNDSFDYGQGAAYQGGSDLNKYSYANISTSWSSSDTSVATVDSNGKITAKGKGKAVITVVHKGGNFTDTFTNSASCTVVVGDHEHCEEGDTACSLGHKSYEFEKWTSTTSLPTTAGHYYLANNVTLSTPATISSDVVICLNGKKITANSENGALNITGGNVTLCDCKETGSVYKNGEIADGKGIVTVEGGTFNLCGAFINGEDTTGTGGLAINIKSGATLNINNGAVTGGKATKKGGAIANSGTFNLNGGEVTGGEAEIGGVVYAAGTVNIKGGKLSGGTAEKYGGTMYIDTDNCNITGGIITDGVAKYGGCITVGTGKTFNLRGGLIENGEAERGGCVYILNSTMNIYGGTIKRGTTLNTTFTCYGGNIFIGNESKPSVLNMYGGSIENGQAYGMSGNINVTGGTTFNLFDGTVSNGNATSYTTTSGSKSGGHGGNCFVSGTLNISGGTITAGVASSNGGGNLSVNGAGSRVYMTGGVIKNGSSTVKGKGNVYIWNNATSNAFEMTGGKITSDSSILYKNGYYGGGVYVTDQNTNKEVIERNIKISGDAVITGNICYNEYSELTNKNTPTYANVILEGDKKLDVGKCNAANIGVTLQSETGTGTFTIGGANYKYAFTSDAKKYIVTEGENLAIADEAATNEPTSNTLTAREGKPSDVDLVLPKDTSNIIQKDDYIHFNIAAGETLDFATKFSGVTGIQATGNLSVSGTKVSGTKDGTMATVDVYTSSGTKKCAVAVGHYHCLECGTYACQIHNNILFTASSSFEVNKTQNIYLTNDVNLTSRAGIDSASAKNANICLNGKTVTSPDNDRVMYLNGTSASHTTSITDCSENESGKLVANGTVDHDRTGTAFDYNGALVTVASNNTLNLYKGTLDSSKTNLAATISGGVIQTSGTFNMYGGKLIGPLSHIKTGGAVYVSSSSGKFNMSGGTIDAFNCVTDWGSAIDNLGTVVMDYGRIIGGTHTNTTSSASDYYSSVASYGAVVLEKSSKFTLNGGVIQDGTAIQEFKYNEDGSYYGIRHPGGNICTMDYSTLNINGGVIYGGHSFGTGGNIYAGANSHVNINDGLITDGIAYKVINDKSANGSHGGNILASGNLNISGGTIQNGISYDAYGGNISIYSASSSVKMSGGLIKNGMSTKTNSGSVAVWYHAGNTSGTKTAFNMTGGTITCDSDYVVPNGLHLGGLSVMYTNSGYSKRVKISGSVKIYGGDTNLYVSSGGEQIYIGELSDDAIIYATVLNEGTFAYYAEESALSKLKTDERSTSYALKYDSETGEINTVYINKDKANQFIDKYLTDASGNIYCDLSTKSVAGLESTNALNAWNLLDSESQAEIELTYRDKTGVLNLGNLLIDAHDLYNSISAAQNFLKAYPKDTNGKYITEITEENYQDIIAVKEAYNKLNSEQKTLVDSEITTSVADLIIEAESIRDITIPAKTFLETYFTENGEYVKEVTSDNAERIASAESIWDDMAIEISAKAEEILGADIDALIDAAKTELADKTAANTFLDTYLKDGNSYIKTITYENCEKVNNAKTAYNALSSGAKAKAGEILGADISALLTEAANMLAEKQAAENFLNNYFKGSDGYNAAVTSENAEKIASAENSWNSLGVNEKAYANSLLGVEDIGAVITEAKTLKANIEAAQDFLENHFKAQNGTYYTEATEENMEAVLAAKDAYNALSEDVKSLVNGILGTSAGDVIASAEALKETILAANDFVEKYFTRDGEIVTEVTLITASSMDEFFQKGAYKNFDALSDDAKLYVNNLVIKAGANNNAAELMKLAKDYIKMLSVNYKVSDDKKHLLFYAGLDNLDHYNKAGFEIDYGLKTETVLTTTGVATDTKIGSEGIKTASEISDIAEYVYTCDYTVFARDYNRSAFIRTFVELADGTRVWGKTITVVFSQKDGLKVLEAKDDKFDEMFDFDDFAE